MQRRQHRESQLPAAARQSFEDAAQRCSWSTFSARWTVASAKRSGRESEALQHRRGIDAPALAQHLVHHGVAGDVDARVRDPLAQ